MATLLLVAVTMIVSLTVTPIIIAISKRLNLVDKPSFRKIHTKPISVMGDTVILFSFLIGIWVGHPVETEIKSLIIGAIIIYILGFVGDIYDLKPHIKLVGQIAAALAVAFYGITIGFVSSPMDTTIHFGFLSIPITMIWIVVIIDAINLIDGPDGLASSVSAIGLITIGFIVILQANIFIAMICCVLLSSLIRFLFYNFHLTKIFLGDSETLVIGFIIEFLSLLRFRNIIIIALFLPVVILTVPFIDTLFAMIRRMKKGRHIMQADKSHLHHKLLVLDYIHRQTVLLIYSISILLNLSSIILYVSPPLGVVLMFVLTIFSIELIVESAGLIDNNYRPILSLINRKSSHKEE